MPRPAQENLQLPWLQAASTLGYNELNSAPCMFPFSCVGEHVIHCLCVDTAAVFDLLMLKLSTSCHFKTWPVLISDCD